MKKKKWKISIMAGLIMGLGASGASADIVLWNLGFNVDGTMYTKGAGSILPGSFNQFGFDWDSGLGSSADA